MMVALATRQLSLILSSHHWNQTLPLQLMCPLFNPMMLISDQLLGVGAAMGVASVYRMREPFKEEQGEEVECQV